MISLFRRPKKTWIVKVARSTGKSFDFEYRGTFKTWAAASQYANELSPVDFPNVVGEVIEVLAP